jgi:carotenoid cleavage dioxygenase-like enzyme
MVFAKTITPIQSHLSEVAIVEAGNIEKGAIARIKVPFRLRVQVHGNWVPANEL